MNARNETKMQVYKAIPFSKSKIRKNQIKSHSIINVVEWVEWVCSHSHAKEGPVIEPPVALTIDSPMNVDGTLHGAE